MQDIVFIMALKNRRQRAIDSVASIQGNFDTCIVQELDNDNLQQSDVPNTQLINVNIGGFNKAKLLNHGIRQTNQPIIIQWDADILFTPLFLNAINILQVGDFKRFFFTCPYIETDNMVDPVTHIGRAPRRRRDVVSFTLAISREHLEKVRGWDERIEMWNEEYDLMNRLNGYGLKQINMGTLGFFNFHKTHENNIRYNYSLEANERNCLLLKSNVENQRCVVNDENWGLV